MNIETLPYINVVCNFSATIFLLIGRYAIFKKRVILHRNCMLIALCWSAIFLGSYLIYHYNVGHKVYPYDGFRKIFYLIILIPHILLAGIVLPLIFKTLYHALKDQKEKHIFWAKRTFPIWLYVSFSGIFIFFMLYL